MQIKNRLNANAFLPVTAANPKQSILLQDPFLNQSYARARMQTVPDITTEKMLPLLMNQYDVRRLKISKNLIPLSVSINLKKSLGKNAERNANPPTIILKDGNRVKKQNQMLSKKAIKNVEKGQQRYILKIKKSSLNPSPAHSSSDTHVESSNKLGGLYSKLFSHKRQRMFSKGNRNRSQVLQQQFSESVYVYKQQQAKLQQQLQKEQKMAVSLLLKKKQRPRISLSRYESPQDQRNLSPWPANTRTKTNQQQQQGLLTMQYK